ncbi:hypothetical protein T484DRAFT_1789908 [Baffinella frigidus]|nr:hypothetical protein T484DRAFT_1789908 [Cryptophyta sp. CCMP2293]
MVLREQPGWSHQRATPDVSLISHTGRSVSPPPLFLHSGWLSAKRGGATAGARAAQEQESIRVLLEQRLGLQTARYDQHKHELVQGDVRKKPLRDSERKLSTSQRQLEALRSYEDVTERIEEALLAQVEERDDRIRLLHSDLSAAEQDATALRTSIASVNRELSSVASALASEQSSSSASINTLQASIDSLEASINSLRGGMAEKEDEARELARSVAERDAELAALRHSKGAAGGEIEALRAELAATDSHLSRAPAEK